MGTVDLHCHILPGVDDGPETMGESLAYAAAAVGDGASTIVATPHVEQVDVRELPDRVRELRTALAREGIDLDVRCGGELKPESLGDLSDGDLDLIAHGPPGARWLLYEVPFDGVDDAFLAGALELRARGFGLVLAHPERSHGVLTGGLSLLEPVLGGGALVAVNLDPLRGGEGPERERAAEQVLRRGLADVVATDAHPPRRSFTLAMARDVVTRLTGRPDAARRLTEQAPARLLAEGIPGAGRRAA